jgi:hypothetical protein
LQCCYGRFGSVRRGTSLQGDNEVSIDQQLALALAERDRGIAAVAGNNQTFIESARSIARMLCRQHGETNADEVRAECEKRGILPRHPNAFGAVFRSKEFIAVGDYISRQKQGHGNKCYRWGLR